MLHALYGAPAIRACPLLRAKGHSRKERIIQGPPKAVGDNVDISRRLAPWLAAQFSQRSRTDVVSSACTNFCCYREVFRFPIVGFPAAQMHFGA